MENSASLKDSFPTTMWHHKPSPLISPAANTSTIGHTSWHFSHYRNGLLGHFESFDRSLGPSCPSCIKKRQQCWLEAVHVPTLSQPASSPKNNHLHSLLQAAPSLLSLFVDPKCCTIVCQWIRCSIICNVMPRLIWQNRPPSLQCQ